MNTPLEVSVALLLMVVAAVALALFGLLVLTVLTALGDWLDRRRRDPHPDPLYWMEDQR